MKQGKHAVVVGGSLAGLMAARVLADHYERVTIIERDSLPSGAELRKGVPQASHAHTLLIRGQQIMEGLFPGLTADLMAAGAVRSDSSGDLLWHQHGVAKLREPIDLPVISMSRALLEWKMRNHCLQHGSICLMQGFRVTRPMTDLGRTRVTGVLIEPVSSTERVRTLQADLVVDASGRGSRTPAWLQEMGYPEVPVTEIKTQVAYTSRLYKRPPGAPSRDVTLLFAEQPSTRIGVIFPIEGERWLVTLQAMLGDQPPTDEEGFLAFARSLPLPVIYDRLKDAEPLGPAVGHKTPSSLRRHYERMARFPEGLVVLGDAACSLNPRYGQGMTAAALGVEVLQQCLQEQAGLSGFSRLFQQRLARAVELPWQASAGEDLSYPATVGVRPAGAGLINWYLRRLIRLTSRDREALVAFISVVHLLKPMTALLRPSLLWKALLYRNQANNAGVLTTTR